MKKIFVTLVVGILITISVMFLTKEDRLVKDVSIDALILNDIGINNNTFYYEKLDEIQKKYYRVIGNGILNLDEGITIKVTKEKQYDNVKNNIEIALTAFLADHPEIFYVNDKYEISLTDVLVVKIIKLNLEYITNEKDKINQMQAALKERIKTISQKARNYTSSYEKEEFIHDFIAKNVVYYDYDNFEEIPTIKHTAYAALVEGTAVCDGITKAFQLALNDNNIESIFVTGSTEGVAHAWCKVKLDNEYYNVDLTSNKALNIENRDLIIHSYFNVTDEEILKTHTIDKKETLPQCTATKYNYYVYNDYQIGYMDGFEYKLRQIVNKQKTKPLLELSTIGISNVPEKLITSLYDLNYNNFKTNNVKKIQYININNNYIVTK